MPKSKAMELIVFDLSLTGYDEALSFQKQTWQKVRENILPSALIICEHYPVITLGRQGKPANILAGPEDLRQKNITVFSTDRGGDVTYHGPGQIIFYPVFNLNFFGKDIHLFLRNLEEAVIRYLNEKIGIYGHRLSEYTGVWVNDKKIASIGIAVRQWITYHGLSLNVYNSVKENFRLIRPCGTDKDITSIEEVKGIRIGLEEVKRGMVDKIKQVFRFQEAGTLEVMV